MSNIQLVPAFLPVLDGIDVLVEPNALLQQRPVSEADVSSSCTTPTPSVPRLSTPDTEADDYEAEADKWDNLPPSKRPSSRSETAKVPAARSASSKSNPKVTGTTATTAATMNAGGAAKKRHKRNLERNRIAASKCRQRKKQWQGSLERHKIELENRYKALHSESIDLFEEIAQLKNLVMAHATCKDVNIEGWIRSEADNFVRRMSTAHRQHQHQKVTLPPQTTTSAPKAGVTASVSMAQLQEEPTTDAPMSSTPGSF